MCVLHVCVFVSMYCALYLPKLPLRMPLLTPLFPDTSAKLV